MPRALHVVLNYRSGRRDGAECHARLEAALAGNATPYRIVESRKGSDVAAIAHAAAGEAARDGGVLIAAGGDGTLNAVANAAWAADVPFGAVPLGTFNYFARVNALPLEPEAAIAAIAAGVERPVQVGLVNGRVFLVNASVGFYPQLLEDREAFKAQYGRKRWVALLAALWTLVTRTQPKLALRIVAEDEEARAVRVSTLFVGNNPLQFARLGLAQAQDVEDGRLAAIRVRPTSAWRLLDILLYGAIGRLGQADGVHAFSFGEMEVGPFRPSSRRRSVKVAMDGETHRMALPLVFRVAPRPLRLVGPPA